MQRVFLFGCHKDDATLDKILPPDVFDGIGVSDDAVVIAHRENSRPIVKCRENNLSSATVPSGIFAARYYIAIGCDT